MKKLFHLVNKEPWEDFRNDIFMGEKGSGKVNYLLHQKDFVTNGFWKTHKVTSSIDGFYLTMHPGF